MQRERKHLNCAIYTRKSSEEGLEQEFNSLDAQREACEAFIQSQRHEGWKAVPTHYDDGGFSGGTMERPGLQKLIADIEAGKVHVVVVYKVDRLTRALADFAKIVELFDAKSVSFVSVTQQFNTTTSMGRLTLNVLLSFAQFEREVTGERIRDKIAASKKKGMWMGGYPPLGYDARERRLVEKEREAETVRHIFSRYVALGSVRALKADLDRAGIVSKVRTSKAGNVSGGKSLSRGALYKMLSNRIYIGEIVHKDKSYPGEHDAIVDAELWERVQSLLHDNAVDRRAGANAKEPSLLTGLIFDEFGNPLTPSHANKKGVRYRYYVRNGNDEGSATRLPAREIENVVLTRLRGLLDDPISIFELISEGGHSVVEHQSVIERASDVSRVLDGDENSETKEIVEKLVRSVEVKRDRIHVTCNTDALSEILGVEQPEKLDSSFVLDCPYTLKRRGNQAKLILDNAIETSSAEPDFALIRAVARAHVWNKKLMEGELNSAREIARTEEVTPRYIYKLLPLAHLAPDIVTSICEGRQPKDLTLDALVYADIPVAWEDQRRKFGFRAA